MSNDHYWWSGLPAERYWCEITDRDNPGDDLLCPQTQEGGKPYWSYSLIRQIRPGDLVFHYYTPQKAFVGASVAIGVAVPDTTSWVPHGTVGRRKRNDAALRPAWRLPISGYVAAKTPLTLAEVQKDEDWVRRWIAEKKASENVVASPFQSYPSKLRGQQGYLTKMPAAFVDRWPKLKELVSQLAGTSYVEELVGELRDSDAVLTAVLEDVRRYRGQGFNVSPRACRAIEDFAVQRAKSYYESQGYFVEVQGKPYDLRCLNSSDVLHVEVKGTTTAGEEILLTPNEVAFANNHAMALFIVSRIHVSEGDHPIASGGTELEIRPWKIEREHLTPVSYWYVVPRSADAEK